MSRNKNKDSFWKNLFKKKIPHGMIEGIGGSPPKHEPISIENFPVTQPLSDKKNPLNRVSGKKEFTTDKGFFFSCEKSISTENFFSVLAELG